jgi:hypothetical protein
MVLCVCVVRSRQVLLADTPADVCLQIAHEVHARVARGACESRGRGLCRPLHCLALLAAGEPVLVIRALLHLARGGLVQDSGKCRRKAGDGVLIGEKVAQAGLEGLVVLLRLDADEALGPLRALGAHSSLGCLEACLGGVK